ncbi:MAG TPA: DUF4332 domain-containing protein, partial [Dehalococcoidia bacterium]|nr:DUF4332 domain-containing protein [Dehalococcoidia bacterium]
MPDRITQIEGIQARYAKTLQAAGVSTTEDLLREAGAPQKRTSLAGKLGVQPATLLEWVNRADLMRIKGIGTEYADLLEESGVDSTRELANRVPANLHASLDEANRRRHLVQRVPSQVQVEHWV